MLGSRVLRSERDHVRHDWQSMNAKKVFAKYICIDTSEKPPNEGVKTLRDILHFDFTVNLQE